MHYTLALVSSTVENGAALSNSSCLFLSLYTASFYTRLYELCSSCEARLLRIVCIGNLLYCTCVLYNCLFFV